MAADVWYHAHKPCYSLCMINGFSTREHVNCQWRSISENANIIKIHICSGGCLVPSPELMLTLCFFNMVQHIKGRRMPCHHVRCVTMTKDVKHNWEQIVRSRPVLTHRAVSLRLQSVVCWESGSTGTLYAAAAYHVGRWVILIWSQLIVRCLHAMEC